MLGGPSRPAAIPFPDSDLSFLSHSSIPRQQAWFLSSRVFRFTAVCTVRCGKRMESLKKRREIGLDDRLSSLPSV